MEPERRGGGEKVGRVGGAIVRMYCIRQESIFNKRGECKRTAKNAPCKVLLAYTAIISIPSLKSNTNNSIAFLM